MIVIPLGLFFDTSEAQQEPVDSEPQEYTSNAFVCSGFTYTDIASYHYICNHPQLFSPNFADRLVKISYHLDNCEKCYSLMKSVEKLPELDADIFH